MIGLWPRVLELLLGLWLLLSPGVLGHGGESALGLADRLAGTLIVVVAALSMIPRLSRIHFATLAIGLALGAWAWASFERPGPAGAQSQILVGLSLALLALVPTGSTRPPEEWRPFVDEEPRGGEGPADA